MLDLSPGGTQRFRAPPLVGSTPPRAAGAGELPPTPETGPSPNTKASM